MVVAFLAAAAEEGEVDGLVEDPSVEAYATRAQPSALDIAGFVPSSKGVFNFPSPYGSKAWRITDSTDRGGASNDNVIASGYSYWRQLNAHTGENIIKVLVGVNNILTIFHINKTTDVVTNEGRAINVGQSFSGVIGENIYWSGSDPDKFYCLSGQYLVRYDHVTNTRENVVDMQDHGITGASYPWQPSSSDDDNWHVMTVRNGSNQDIGAFYFDEGAGTGEFVANVGLYDEAQVSRSGDYVSIKDNEDSTNGEDCRIFNTSDDTSRFVKDEDGAPGHSDWGWNWIAWNDNYGSQANTLVAWDCTLTNLTDVIQYYNSDWTVEAPAHVSCQGGSGAMTGKIVCGSSSNTNNSPHSNEIVCYKMDATRKVLVVCPTMTAIGASFGDGFGGGAGIYYQRPKANMDVGGEYAFFTSNLMGSELDAFVVKIPAGL